MNKDERTATGQLLTKEQALERILNETAVLRDIETISIYRVAGRIAARDYSARIRCPGFDRSPLDGYAVCHEVFPENISRENLIKLQVSMKIYAGDTVAEPLAWGTAARIMTGAMIPKGADCVIRQEDTDYGEETVTFYGGAREHDNICFAGEDIETGTLIVSKGQRLTAAMIGVLAGQGHGSIEVFKIPTIGVLSTGSELSHPEAIPLQTGKIFDSNGPMICARMCELGFFADGYIEGDDEARIEKRMGEMLVKYDVIVTTGGVSVGQKDYLPQVIKRMGARVLFHGVAMKPGSPMLVAILEGKLIFALSGNPFAAFATAELFLVPAVIKLSGNPDFQHTQQYMRLKNDFPKESKGRRFLRGFGSAYGVDIPENNSSGSLAGSIHSNCLIDIPRGSEALKKGTWVKTLLFKGRDSALTDREQKEIAEIPIFAVSGFHKTGKTSLLEETIKCLKDKGCIVGIIKHDGHGFQPDVPGTDSYRLKMAGADAVMVYSKEMQQLIQDIDVCGQEAMVERMLLSMERKPHILLLEGFKHCNYPKLFLEEAQENRQKLKQQGRELAERLWNQMKGCEG